MKGRWLWGLLITAVLVSCRPPFAAGRPAPPPMTPTAAFTTAVATPIPTLPPTPTTEQPAASTANADVLFVRAVQAADSSWTFHVTVAHPDTGWEDYADGWDVVLPDGTVAKPDPDSPFTRLLLHPHETEQPFTRSQSGIIIPAGISTVRVRAHDLVDGFGGQEVVLDWTALEAETAVSTDTYEITPHSPD